MAKRVTALADLKTSFGKFGEMSGYVSELNEYLRKIDDSNRDCAGKDEVGNAYRSQVDKGTDSLHKLVKAVSDALDMTAIKGMDTSDLFDNAEDAASQAAGG